jgi:isoquinoline 1-oxidoreductase subunit beta
VCAVDLGTAVNPETIQAQVQSGAIFGITAALYGEITLKNGRVEQSNFDTYQMLRIDEAPVIEVHIVQSSGPPGASERPAPPASCPPSATPSLRPPASGCARCRSIPRC